MIHKDKERERKKAETESSNSNSMQICGQAFAIKDVE
jgi:hypothetical protein